MPDACETFREICHASPSLHIKSPTNSLLLFRQTVDGVCLSVFRYTAAVQPGQTGSAQYQIPVTVVESEMRVADFRQVAHFML